ncbi:hypothetical protein [Pontibacter amylolyticus]|uniref:DUF3298 domain-containing protein n=1 Tax=Pontibacter amylolyticus TaxID=1424080 RepID=A0ABQ1W2C7_9BACT|nr:hypothetical protein [Pontibacter amylolyticus]GGG10165.1 hypothetical protein GCM10011323_13420 [Pontibacter amylolyticus]
MRNLVFLIPLVLCLGMSFGCEQSKRGLTEADGITIESAEETITDAPAEAVSPEPEPEEQTATESTATACEEKDEDNPGSEDPIIVRTCTYQNYRSVATGMPDYKGRYSWEHALYKLENEAYVPIKNESLFNDKRNALLRQVNQRIRAEYHLFAGDPDFSDCFTMAETIPEFGYEDLNIGFEDDQLVFHASLGLPEVCLSIDGASVSFKLSEVAPYLQQ